MFERAQDLIDRRRLVIGLCAAVALALIAAVPGILTGGDSGRKVRTTEAAQATPTTSNPVVNASPGDLLTPLVPPPSPTTTTPAVVLGTTFSNTTTTVGGPAPKAAPAPARSSSPATTAAPKGSPPTSVCRNSYDPACGAFRWDPPPAQDQPEQVTITPSKTTARVGEQVDFSVHVADPDNTHFVECAFKWDYGDGPGVMTTHCDPAPGSNACPARYGPWTPPSAAAGSEQFAGIGHSWSAPGTYTVSYTHDSRPNSCYNPYASAGTATATITVIP